MKDSTTTAEPGLGYRYVLPGRGEFPIDQVKKLLLQSSYRGHVSLEWERHWVPTLPPLEAALEAMIDSGWWLQS